MMSHTKIVSVLFTVIFISSCGSPENVESENPMASIDFMETTHNFGNIPYTSDGRCYFEFTNTSKKDLLINNVRTTCGCTRPEWPEKPIKPGSKGKIGITYNTKMIGNFNKGITVYSNTQESPTKLFIKGNVVEKYN